MITHVIASFSTLGETFSPHEAERITGLKFTSQGERGEIATRGKYRGQPLPHGHASLYAPREMHDDVKLDWLLDMILPHASTLRSLGATDGHVYVSYSYEAQCNLAFRSTTLARLAALEFDFWISCYEDDPEPDDA